MDITPRIAAGRQVVNAYGNGGFRISGVAWTGSVLILPERTMAWPVEAIAEVTAESLQPIVEAEPKVEILLLGWGPSIARVKPELRAALKAGGIVVDGMDTGAACRTYNVLLSEERRVAAALIAVR